MNPDMFTPTLEWGSELWKSVVWIAKAWVIAAIATFVILALIGNVFVLAWLGENVF